jgi:4-carboxymuconolactone decarboxylase
MRLSDLDPARLDAAQKRVYDAIMSGPRGRVEGPLRVWLASAELADKAQQLGAFCRYGTSLPPRLSELAILVTGAHWRAGFEWFVHAPIAIKAGLRPEVVAAIKAGDTPRFETADEAAVHDFAKELLETKRVATPTYRRVVDLLGETAAVELVGVLGYYGLISMTICAFEVPVPPGETEPFA